LEGVVLFVVSSGGLQLQVVFCPHVLSLVVFSHLGLWPVLQVKLLMDLSWSLLLFLACLGLVMSGTRFARVTKNLRSVIIVLSVVFLTLVLILGIVFCIFPFLSCCIVLIYFQFLIVFCFGFELGLLWLWTLLIVLLLIVFGCLIMCLVVLQLLTMGFW
jgi:hypothetical protein